MSAERIDVPTTPEPDPCDYRTQSAPVVIHTVSGEWYTARWTVYQDEEFAPCWELIGRDGLQLDRAEVVAWFYPSVAVELIEADREYDRMRDAMDGTGLLAAANRRRAALARIGAKP